MTKSDKKKDEKTLSKDEENIQNIESKKNDNFLAKKETVEDKLKGIEEKLLRTLAEMENQRRRFEKERQEAFDFGGFNFARESLALLDNMDRATDSFKNDENFSS